MSRSNTLSLPPRSGDIDLSVVIVSYNTRDITLDCVQSLMDHAGDVTLQIIAVDNCSQDGSAAALREKFPLITVIDSPANGGFAFGNNIGFEQAVGRYILLLNPDTRVYDGTLQDALSHMDANPKVGILGPKVLLENGEQQSSMIHFLSLTQLFFIIFMPSLWLRKTALFGDLRYANLSREEVNDVDAVSGCFMLARREILEMVGGLDQRFFMYGEESEWCHRSGRAGWTIRYNPVVRIMHYGAASSAHMSEWKSVEMAKGHILFLRFTRGKLIGWLGNLLMVIRDLVRLPWYAAKAIANGFSWTSGARPWLARLKFLSAALFAPPVGQSIERPTPDQIVKEHIR